MKVNFGSNDNLRVDVRQSSPVEVIFTQSGSTQNINVKPQTGYTVAVNQSDSRLQTNSPISLRNVVNEGAQATVENIEDIENVFVVNRVDGSTVVYDSVNARYEVKLMDLDGGTF